MDGVLERGKHVGDGVVEQVVREWEWSVSEVEQVRGKASRLRSISKAG